MLSDNAPSSKKSKFITGAGVKESAKDHPATRAGNFMALHGELDRLEDMIMEGGPRVFGHTVVDEEKVCRQIDQIRMAIPESIAKAEEILQYRDDIIADAEKYVEQIVKKAQADAQRLVDDSTIVRQADLEATQLRRRTQEDCDQMRFQTAQEIEQMRRQAQADLEMLQHQVHHEVDSLQRSADDYSDRTLAGLESQLLDMLKIVQNGRQSLRR
jgi:cell division septum initiation protein DivIVA